MDDILFGKNKPYIFKNRDASPFENSLYTLNQGGYVSVYDGYEITRKSGYKYHLFHYVFQGSGLLIVDGKEFSLKEGDMFILCSGEPHVYAGNDDDRLGLMWLEICGSNSDAVMRTIKSSGLRCVSSPFSKETRNNMYNLLQYVKDKDKFDYFSVSIMLYKLLCDTMRLSLTQENQTNVYPEYINAAISYIQMHLYDNISVNGLADYVGYSVSHFTKVFSSFVGVNPSQYIIMKKIEEATRLLSGANPTCEELAHKLGFYDATHFVKMYKKHTGHTPKKM